MRSFLTWLVGEGLLRANPAQNIKPPKVKRKAREVLSRQDLEALVAAQPTLRDQVALTLLVWLGLRKDELRQLRLRDIDLQERTLVVHGKGGHLDKLPMGFEHVYNALALYMRDREADEYLLHPERRPLAAMEASTVHRWFKKALERAGLSTEWALHDLRRAAADALHDVTGDIVLAQQLLRHSDIRTTRGYLSPSMERLAQGMRQVEEALHQKDAG